jgi:hypothetical protein
MGPLSQAHVARLAVTLTCERPHRRRNTLDLLHLRARNSHSRNHRTRIAATSGPVPPTSPTYMGGWRPSTPLVYLTAAHPSHRENTCQVIAEGGVTPPSSCSHSPKWCVRKLDGGNCVATPGGWAERRLGWSDPCAAGFTCWKWNSRPTRPDLRAPSFRFHYRRRKLVSLDHLQLYLIGIVYSACPGDRGGLIAHRRAERCLGSVVPPCAVGWLRCEPFGIRICLLQPRDGCLGGDPRNCRIDPGRIGIVALQRDRCHGHGGAPCSRLGGSSTMPGRRSSRGRP